MQKVFRCIYLIRELTTEQVFLNGPLTLAYVTYEDIRRLAAFQEQTLFVVKAPEETKLEVPPPKEVKQLTFLYKNINMLFGFSFCPFFFIKYFSKLNCLDYAFKKIYW